MSKKTVEEQIYSSLKDLRKLKSRIFRAAIKHGNNSFGLDYEIAAGRIDCAMDEILSARQYYRSAERKKKKCEK